MRLVDEKPRKDEDGVWHLFGIRHIEDLRGQFDRSHAVDEDEE
jgi:hypothetical protein